MNGTKIIPGLTQEDARRIVIKALDLDNADEAAPQLAGLFLFIANADKDNGRTYNIAMAAARQCFEMTSRYERAFMEFAGLPNFGQTVIEDNLPPRVRLENTLPEDDDEEASPLVS